jgi:hypothetical protein
VAVPTIDIGFLEYFSPIFVFVLVFVVVYAMFQFTKFMGENKVLHSLIAFFVAVIFLFSTAASDVVLFVAPWFTVFFIFLIFLIMAYKLFGATDDQIKTVISKWHAGQYMVAAIGIIIMLFGLGSGLGQNLLGYTQEEAAAGEVTDLGEDSTATASYKQNLVATIFNTRVLGMILILIIASLTIRAMSASMRPEWP